MNRGLQLIVLAVLSLPLPILAAGPRGAASPARCGDCLAQAVAAAPHEQPDAWEETDLLFMREEEKLARDVYRAMDDQWGLRAFANIALSEQRHMDAVLSILVKYGIVDPVGDNLPGVFDNPELQNLHDTLSAAGAASIVAALHVGATIEDLDLFDLQTAIARADNDDILTVYQNLAKASRNHLRTFVSLLRANGETYEPQYIDRVTFEGIIGTAKETGRLDASGQPTGVAGSTAGGPLRQRRTERPW